MRNVWTRGHIGQILTFALATVQEKDVHCYQEVGF